MTKLTLSASLLSDDISMIKLQLSLEATSKESSNFVMKMSSERIGSKCQLCCKNVFSKIVRQ